MINGFVRLGEFHNQAEAALIQSRLMASGIESVVENEMTSALQIPFTGGMRLLVAKERAEEAKAVLDATVEADVALADDFEYADEEHAGVRICPACHGDDIGRIRSLISLFQLPLALIGMSALGSPKRWQCRACHWDWQE